MYQITVNGTVVYDTQYRGQYPLISPVLELGMNQAGTLGFTVLPNHPYYANFQRMKSFVKFYRDSEELFYGRIIAIEKDIYGQMAVNCEGAFTFFLDSELEKGEYTETIPAFITRCITAHNSQVEVEKRFTVGQMTANKAVEIDPSTGSVIQIKFAIQDYATTKSTLESLITGKYGGCFRVRPNPNGLPFLDYIQDYGRTNPQTIKIAENISSKTDHISGENIFSILRPLGKEGLTIESLSQSDVTLPNVVKDGKTLRLTEMITAYGNVIRTERFSDIDDASALLKAAEEFITRYGSQLPATSTVGYVDFHLLNPQIDAVRVGDMFTNIDGFPDETLTVGELRINAENPADDEIVFKNREELNANDPTSSSSSLSASYASQCMHIDYIYKYIREEDNLLLLEAEKIESHSQQLLVTSQQIKQVAGQINSVKGNVDQIVGSAIWQNKDSIVAAVGQIDTINGHLTDVDTSISKIEGSALWIDRDNIVSSVGTISTLNGKISNIEGSNLWLDRDHIVSSVGTISTLNGKISNIEGSTLWLNRDSITGAIGKMYVDANGKLHIIDGSGLYLDNGQSSLGVYTEGNLDAGIIISKLNDNSTQAQIRADVINLSSYATGSYVDNAVGTITGSRLWIDRNTILQSVGSSGDLRGRVANLEGAVSYLDSDEIALLLGSVTIQTEYIADNSGDYGRTWNSTTGEYDYYLVSSSYSGQRYRLDQNVNASEAFEVKDEYVADANGDYRRVYDSNLGQYVYELASSSYTGTRYRLDRNVHINEGVGLKIDRKVGSQTASFGVYDQNNLTAGYIISMINGQSTATIQADKINLEGYVTTNQLNTKIAEFYNAYSDTISADWITVRGGQIGTLTTSSLTVDGRNANNAVISFGTPTESSGQISIPYTKLGGGTGTINFNIAATQYYIDGVAAAASSVTLSGTWTGNLVNGKSYKVTASNGQTNTSPAVNSIFANGSKTWASDNKSFTQMISVQDANGTDIIGNTLTFDTSVCYAAGRSSVGINAITLRDTPTYDSTNKRFKVPIYVKLNTGLENTTAYVWCAADDAFDAGANSIYVSGVDVDSEYSYSGYHYVTITIRLPNGNNNTQTIRVPIS